jgi:ribonuclease-3
MKNETNRKLNEFQDLINYKFKNPDLLLQALTTPQYGNEKQIPHYDILETLGDAVIKLILSLKLFSEGQDDPGKLTQTKQRLEDNFTFIKIGKEMNLDKFIFSSLKQRVKGTSIIADVFEAVCGAMYLDNGKDLDIVEEKIIDRFLVGRDDIVTRSPHLLKNQLLEYLQDILKLTPKIKFEYEKSGPDDDLRWTAKNPIILDNNRKMIIELPKNFESNKFKSKKEAEKELSMIILNYLKNED